MPTQVNTNQIKNLAVTMPKMSSGWQTWTNIAPTGYLTMTYTAVTIVEAKYVVVGKICYCKAIYHGTTGGTAQPRLTATLPVTAVGYSTGPVNLDDAGQMIGVAQTNGDTSLTIYKYNGASWSLGTLRYVVLSI